MFGAFVGRGEDRFVSFFGFFVLRGGAPLFCWEGGSGWPPSDSFLLNGGMAFLGSAPFAMLFVLGGWGGGGGVTPFSGLLFLRDGHPGVRNEEPALLNSAFRVGRYFPHG